MLVSMGKSVTRISAYVEITGSGLAESILQPRFQHVSLLVDVDDCDLDAHELTVVMQSVRDLSSSLKWRRTHVGCGGFQCL